MRQREALRPRLLLSVDLCVLAPLRLCVLLLHPFDLAKQLPGFTASSADPPRQAEQGKLDIAV